MIKICNSAVDQTITWLNTPLVSSLPLQVTYDNDALDDESGRNRLLIAMLMVDEDFVFC